MLVVSIVFQDRVSKYYFSRGRNFQVFCPACNTFGMIYTGFCSSTWMITCKTALDERWFHFFREREGTIFYSTLPLPPAHEYSDCKLDEIYRLIELPFDWLIMWCFFVCLLDDLILGFCYSNLRWETGGLELTSTITVVLWANRLTKCASHPRFH